MQQSGSIAGTSRPFLRRAAASIAVLAAGTFGLYRWLLRPTGPAAPALPGVLTTRGLRSGGRPRTWLSYVPPTLAGPAPVVLVLHGSTQDGAAIRRATAHRFERLAEEHGFVVAYPDGVDGNWNECRVGGDFTAKREGVDDVAFLRAVVDEMDDALSRGVDRDRVFATGYSSGGQMSLRLAFEAADLVAAIAPVAANVPVADNLAVTDAGVPVPALFVEGTKDPMNPFEGGDVALYGRFGSRGHVLSAEESRAWFARRNGDSGAPVELITVLGGGHHYPADGYRGPRFLGPSSHTVDAPSLVWEFFSQVG